MALPYKFKIDTFIQEGRVQPSDIQEIQTWMKKDSLPEIQDEMIGLFLLSCDNNVENTKHTIQAYFEIKINAPDLFTNRDIDSEELQKAMQVITCVSIPTRLPNRTTIHFFGLRDPNYRNFDLIASMKLAFMLIEITQRTNPPNDIIVVFDIKGANLMHLSCIKLNALKKFFAFLQEAMPLKMQKIHILNANYLYDKALAIAKVFIKSELMKLIVLHSPSAKMEDFHRDYIPAAHLPKEYDGELPSCEELNRKSIEQFQELKEFFEAEEALVRSYRKV